MSPDTSSPTSVTVTEHVIDITQFSHQWREHAIDLARIIASYYEKSGKERFIVALGGPSGTSKSTTAKVLEHLLRSEGLPAVTASQDGYHFTQEYLLRTLDNEGRPLAEHKGRYDSFDSLAMKHDIGKFLQGTTVDFPEYSRRIHNPIPNAVHIAGPSLLIFEGLWLLYDHAPWNELLPLYNLTIFFHASPEVRRNNTIVRHVRGNEHSPTEAELFYEMSDAKNAEMILGSISRHNIDFYLE